MTIGRPGQRVDTIRWVRERLLGLGLTEDHLILSRLRLPARLGERDLEPASYLAEFAPLVQRIQRLLQGGGRGLSVYVTGGRAEAPARTHTALQIALGLIPTGRQIVLVDADFLRPGLGGLVGDPTAEGVIDLVRFGRSTRSLLQRPVPEGPWLMAAGSFPVEDPVPFGPDALRSLVYRVSQVCDLALYVGPLPIRNELHPLASVCDHVVYAAPDEPNDGSPGLVDAVVQLQQQNAHLAGLVLYAPEVEAPSASAFAPPAVAPPPLPDFAPAPPAPFPAAPAAPVPPLPAAPAAPFAPGSLYAGESEKPAPAPRAPVPSESAEPMAPLPPLPLPLPSQPGAAARGSWSETPRPLPEIDWTQLSPPSFEPAAETSAASKTRQPEPSLDASPFEPPPIRLQGAGKPPSVPADDEDAMSAELIERTRRELAEAVATRRPRDEQREVGRDLDLAQADYAFESESHDSRWPLFLVVALLLAIIGFVSWALWGRSAQRSGPRVVAEAPEKPGDSSDASHAPSDAEASAPHPPATSPTPGNGGSPSSSTNPSPARNPPQDRATQNPATQSPGTQAPASGTNPKTANPSPDDRAAANARPQTSPSTSAPSTSPPTSPPPASTTPSRGTETPASGSETPARPSETPPVTSPSAAANAAANVYAVHVASYKTMKQAQKEIDTLQKYGYPGRAIQTDLGSKGVWFRVYAGSYATAAEADAAREKLLALPEYDFAQVRRLPRD
jgi:hypothetical protein